MCALAPSLGACVTLGKFPNLMEAQFSRPESGDDNDHCVRVVRIR